MKQIDDHKLLKAIFEKSQEAIFVCNEDGRFRYWNNAFLNRTIYEDSELFDIHFIDLISKKDQDNAKISWEQLKTSGNWKGEHRFENRQGFPTFSLMKMDIIESYFVGFSQDFCCDISNYQEMLEVKDRLELATQAGNIGIWVWNLGEEIIVNDVLRDIYGIEKVDNVISLDDIRNKVLPEDLEIIEESLQNAIERLEDFNAIYRISVSKNIKYINTSGQLKIVNGNLIRVYGVNIDVTETITKEQQIIEAKRKAEESEALKSSFLHNISHELRTPLNGIIGFSNLLTDSEINYKERKEYTSLIKASSLRLVETINNIIDISQIETNQLKINKSNFSARSLVEDVYSLYKDMIEAKGLNFNYILDEDIKLNTDLTIVSKIFNHLLSNAIKFTARGSIEIGYESGDHSCTFFVKDTGIGIQKPKKNIIFERFVQGENEISRSYEGSGLGLSISKEMLDLLGGRIYFDTELGKGSTFYFEIPTGDKMPENTIDYAKNDHRVLIVEDDDASYTLLEVLLKREGFQIERATDGIEALDKFDKTADFDLILMDMKLPKMSGYDATKKIREIDKTIKILAVTADALEKDKQKALDSGCDGHLSKPIDVRELKETIYEILN